MEPIYPINTKRMIRLEQKAALELTPTDRTELIDQLNAVLTDLEVLRTCPVGPVCETQLRSALREDVVQPSTARTLLLANAPATDGEFFLVPRTVE